MKSPWILRSFCPVIVGACLLWACTLCPSQAVAQSAVGQAAVVQPDRKAALEQDAHPPLRTEGEKPPSVLMKILDEPRTVDPTTVLPPALAARVTIAFKGQPLRDIVKWLQQDRSFNVIVDYPALAAEGILVGEPITDHSDDAPLYLLLNRLRKMQLDWYFDNETIFITTTTQSELHTTTIPYNLGDLFDAGYQPASVQLTVMQTVDAKWANLDGEGGAAALLGDVLFVRQTFKVHQQIAGLFSALRKHARRTFTLDPVQHEVLRQKMNDRVTVEFDETPLHAAIDELARQTRADIRIDHKMLNDEGISERTPVSLKMTDMSLSTVLQLLLLKLGLTWELDNGVLWVTTPGAAEANFKTAVFDVRDLCRDQKESSGLMAALQTQTNGKWMNVDGEGGGMICPRPGVLVTRQTGKMLDEILKLLENYRIALKASKPREVAEADPKELITKYYRLETEIAVDLEKFLPEIVQPASWRSPAQPEAKATIRVVSSKFSILHANGNDIETSQKNIAGRASLVSNSVLIIHQTRAIHDEIDKIIQKVQYGEAAAPNPNIGAMRSGPMGGGGMGGGMGGGGMGGAGMGGAGFGGGYFSIPAK